MPNRETPHVLWFEDIEAFFDTYRIGRKPHHPLLSIMRLEDQSPNRLQLMPLFRGNFYKIVFFQSEGAKSMLPERPYHSLPSSLYFSYPGKLESWQRIGALRGPVMYFMGEFLGLDPSQAHFDEIYPYFTYDSEFFIMLTPDENSDLSVLAESILKEIDSDSPDRFEMLKPLLQLYLRKIKRAYDRQVVMTSPDQKSKKFTLNQFRKKLDVYVIALSAGKQSQTPSVSLLAEQLHLNANYLNVLLKDLTGKTASAFIQERLMQEAKAYLMHTHLQVAEIAHKLGFGSPAYFNRFFKSNAGETPLQFRKQSSQ